MRWYFWALMAIFVLPLYARPCPTICVIIHEESLCLIPRPVPDPACDNTLNRAFIVHGFAAACIRFLDLCFGASPRDIAREVGKQIADRLVPLCRR